MEDKILCPFGRLFHFDGRKGSLFGDHYAQGEDAVSFYTDKTIGIERYFS